MHTNGFEKASNEPDVPEENADAQRKALEYQEIRVRASCILHQCIAF